MNTQTCTHSYTPTHERTHTYTHVCMRTHTYPCTHALTRIHTFTHTPICMHTLTHPHMYTHTHAHPRLHTPVQHAESGSTSCPPLQGLLWALSGVPWRSEAAVNALPLTAGHVVCAHSVTLHTVCQAQEGRGSEGKAVLTQKEIAEMMIWSLCFIWWGEMSFISIRSCRRRILYCSYHPQVHPPLTFPGWQWVMQRGLSAQGWVLLEKMQQCWADFVFCDSVAFLVTIFYAKNCIHSPREVWCSHSFITRNKRILQIL